MTRFLLSLSLPALLAASAQAARLPLSTDYWKSEVFQREFNGSYRINANIEPVLSSEERGLLIKMQDLMAKGQRSETIKTLQASELLNSSAAIQFNLANVLTEEDELDEAITYYEKALATFPSFLRAHQNLGFTHFKKENLEKAREHLLEAVRLGANNGTVHGLLGHCFLEKEQYEPALRSFREALITQPETRDWSLGIAQALQNLERPDEAFILYQKALNEDPENKDLILQVALLHNDRGETTRAVALLESLRRQDALAAPFELLLGTLLVGQDNLEIGAATLKRVLTKEDFKQPDRALNAIQFCLERGLDSLALELHKLIRPDDLTPTGLTIYQRLKARILLATQPGAPAALEILDALIAKDPLDSHSLFLRARQHLIGEEPFKALLVFDQAIHAQGPFSPRAQLEKAQLLVKLQRYPEAIKEIKSYLVTHSNDTRVQDYLQAVTDLHTASSAGEN